PNAAQSGKRAAEFSRGRISSPPRTVLQRFVVSRVQQMDDDPSFCDFLRRIREGDGTAAEELVRCYEPLIRREVRLRIEDDRLNRLFDSSDLSQSVLAAFFVRAAIGEYDLDSPHKLAQLLVTMARNKLASRARRERRMRRDLRRITATSPQE